MTGHQLDDVSKEVLHATAFTWAHNGNDAWTVMRPILSLYYITPGKKTFISERTYYHHDSGAAALILWWKIMNKDQNLII